MSCICQERKKETNVIPAIIKLHSTCTTCILLYIKKKYMFWSSVTFFHTCMLIGKFHRYLPACPPTGASSSWASPEVYQTGCINTLINTPLLLWTETAAKIGDCLNSVMSTQMFLCCYESAKCACICAIAAGRWVSCCPLWRVLKYSQTRFQTPRRKTDFFKAVVYKLYLIFVAIKLPDND